MPRAYTVATAALTLEMPGKWLDNTLSHIRIPGVQQERQGVARRITVDGMLILAAAAVLIKEIGVPLAAAVEIAERLVGNGGVYRSPGGVDVRLDLPKMKSTMLQRLENAVEIAPIPRRGRPPKTKTGRLD
jgi:hypothetical protein